MHKSFNQHFTVQLTDFKITFDNLINRSSSYTVITHFFEMEIHPEWKFILEMEIHPGNSALNDSILFTASFT